VKTANNTHFEGGTEEIDDNLSTMITTENYLDQQVDLFSEAVQSVFWRIFQDTKQGRKTTRNLYHCGR